MKFRFCCTCGDGEKVKPVENNAQTSETPNTVLPTPTVITQQPKNVVEPIQLDRITEVSVEESSVVQSTEEEEPRIEYPIRSQQTIQDPPIQAPRIAEMKHDITVPGMKEDFQMPTTNSIETEDIYRELLNLLQADRVKQKYIPPVTQPYQTVNQTSNISVDTMIGEEKLTFSQIAPELYQGTFKGSRFHIIKGNIIDYYCAFEESDKAAIKIVYNKVMEGMQRGIQKLTALNGLEQEDMNFSSGATINTNYYTRSGENAVMTFIPIAKGHFRSTYEGKEFTILNGQLLDQDGRFDEQDRKLILQTYNNTLIGMEQGLLGMQQGMLGMRMGMQSMQLNAIGDTEFARTTVQGGAVSSVAVGGSATAYASADIGASAYANAVGGVAMAQDSSNNLATGRETLKRMRSLNHNKRISLLDGGLLAQPRPPVLVIEDITEKSQKTLYFDDVDGGKLSEPVLKKTTFTPQAIIYDDPTTYEEQDKNELSVAKRLDEYIISLDANFNSENRYHFHKARPGRVIRSEPSPKEKFRLASPERYSLFEAECLKLHNQYRKLHGVPPLIHNEFLSEVAKEWAEHLAMKDAFYHRPNNEYGENLYYVEGMPCRAKMAVKAWYDEIDLYDYEKPKFSKEVGHFTQLVWKDTREVGTGVAQIGDKVWVCCNYHPPGNYSDKFNNEFVPRPVMNRIKIN